MSGVGLVLGLMRWKGYQVKDVSEPEDCCSQDTGTTMNQHLCLLGIISDTHIVQIKKGS